MKRIADRRAQWFQDLPWYRALEEPGHGEASAWYLAKMAEHRAQHDLLNTALAYAEAHDLQRPFLSRFGGIALRDLSPAKARAELRSVTAPIWNVADELLVASFLERVLHWEFDHHEPRGHRDYKGDWQFRTPDGQVVFVEVKSVSEPEYPTTGVFSRPHFIPRLHQLLKGAYRQLPDDERANCVVIVAHGGIILEIPYGIRFGDLFQAFFGETVFRAPFDGTSVGELSLTSTHREMFVQPNKNRRLGAVMGFDLGGGISDPAPVCYAIHNPLGHERNVLTLSATEGLQRFHVQADEPRLERGLSPIEIWRKWAARV
ncbi:MAG: hypothetical protein IPK85_04590 [Gemmatimonadetes bacterium]|nr:hypothetical protein [Gemmatimonadota bacterium]